MNARANTTIAANSTRINQNQVDLLYKRYSPFFIVFLSMLFLVVCITKESTARQITLHSQVTIGVELFGFDGLTRYSLFKGIIDAAQGCEIDTSYLGLGLLTFQKGQSYPVILGNKAFTIMVETPAIPPSFSNSQENDFLYRQLLEKTSFSENHDKDFQFVYLMIQAKQLLESSQSIRTMEELTAKKVEFHLFVHDNYDDLKHSDMIIRLIAQYFMMHEYVNYHTEGAPAANIRVQYEEAVLSGVKSWIDLLSTHIPEHEIINYCVSLYYNRSMVALASEIVKEFRSVAYCSGVEKEVFSFPGKLLLVAAADSRQRELRQLKGQKVIAFVSSDCPVSMVTTIIKARQFAKQKANVIMIVAPLQKLSEKHLAMRRMVSGGNMLFINDEKWQEENLVKKIKLPLFVTIE